MADEATAAETADAETQTTAQTDSAETTADEGAKASDESTTEGQTTEEDKAEAGEKEEDTDQQTEVLNIAVPEGMDGFKDDFAKFNADMGAWLKANPDATAADALKEAANRQARLVTDAQKEAAGNFEAQVATWEKEAKADKEYGGADYDKNMAIAMKAIDAFGSDKLKELLNESGLGSHPEVVRFAFRAAKGVAESDVAGSTEVQGDGTALRSRYPSSQG